MNTLVNGCKAAAIYLDPAVQEAHQNGVPAQEIMTGAFMTAALLLRSVNPNPSDNRKAAFLEMAGITFDAMEAVTKSQA